MECKSNSHISTFHFIHTYILIPDWAIIGIWSIQSIKLLVEYVFEKENEIINSFVTHQHKNISWITWNHIFATNISMPFILLFKVHVLYFYNSLWSHCNFQFYVKNFFIHLDFFCNFIYYFCYLCLYLKVYHNYICFKAKFIIYS